MASKKSSAKKGTRKAREVKVLIKLSKRAFKDMKWLLKKSRAGKIGMTEVAKGLKEVKVPLEQMVQYIDATLGEITSLAKETELRRITPRKLNTDLLEITERVNRMLDHGGDWFKPKK
jgi:hypothetical protein